MSATPINQLCLILINGCQQEESCFVLFLCQNTFLSSMICKTSWTRTNIWFFFFFNFSYDVSPWWEPNEYLRSPRTTFMRPYLKKFTISSMATSLCDANFLVVVALVFFLLTCSNLVMNVLIDQLIILIIVAWLLSLLPPSGGCFPVFFVFFGYLLSSLHEGFFFFFFFFLNFFYKKI